MINRDDRYWEQKIQLFLHDPVDKALSIPGHEKRAKKIAEAFGTTTADKNQVARADITAAGIDRARLPGYNPDPALNGAVDFSAKPILTHPLTKQILEFEMLEQKADKTTKAIVSTIEKDTADTCWTRQEYFTYLYFILKKSLVVNDAAGLGFLWEHLPADTRIPDHSVWTHCSMVSSLQTCFSESGEKQASLMVFSLTPVQPFIEKTRKLKDHWTASIIISWLAFEGIKAVIEVLGPDHIIYPSLDDQPFIKWMLKQDEKLNCKKIFDDYEELLSWNQDTSVASLPNKFVFLSPAGQETEIVSIIKQNIEAKWQDICFMVESFINKYTDNVFKEEIHLRFQRQISSYWSMNYSHTKLVSLSDREKLDCFFKKQKFETIFNTVEDFSKGYSTDSIVYPASHALVQAVLAASKIKPENIRQEEPGKKCPVCGEFEILSDNNLFWEKLVNLDSATIKQNEQICALCSVKRFIPRAIQEFGKKHILKPVFQNHDFPSTTQMAARELIDKLNQENLLGDLETQLIEEMHEKETNEYSGKIKELFKNAEKKNITRQEQDKYYAILVMDGDNIGDLVNGETISAKWQDTLHPELAEKFKQNNFPGTIINNYLNQKRLISPGVHSSISGALGSFALYGVPLIINNNKGRLIYAGGDDAAAVLPLSTVMDAAMEINRIYHYNFITHEDGTIKQAPEKHLKSSPFTVLLGSGEQITISGAILICHHKQPLRGAIEDAHKLLKNIAKQKKKKSALVIKLKKRSGHTRIFAANWQEENIFSRESCLIHDSFREIFHASNQGLLSSSLIYSLENLTFPVLSVVEKSDKKIADQDMEKILKLIGYEINHSGMLNKKFPGIENKARRKKKSQRLAEHIAGLLLQWNPEEGKKGKWEFNSGAPEMAAFLSKGGMT